MAVLTSPPTPPGAMEGLTSCPGCPGSSSRSATPLADPAFFRTTYTAPSDTRASESERVGPLFPSYAEQGRLYFSNVLAGTLHELRTSGALKDLAVRKELSKDRLLVGIEELKVLPRLTKSSLPVAGFKGTFEETIGLPTLFKYRLVYLLAPVLLTRGHLVVTFSLYLLSLMNFHKRCFLI